MIFAMTNEIYRKAVWTSGTLPGAVGTGVFGAGEGVGKNGTQLVSETLSLSDLGQSQCSVASQKLSAF
jgi:hypothetical protein